MSEIEKKIDEIIGRMDLEDKVGQCLVLNFVGTMIEDYHRRFVTEFRCGGLRVTPHISSINDEPRIRKDAPYLSPGQYAAVLKELQELAMSRKSGAPLQMVTDQEGDLSVDILRGGFSLFPSNAGMAATGDPALVEKAYGVVARQLRAVGVTWAHGPVLDVNLNPRNPEIGMRAFSDDPKVCAEYGVAMMKGLVGGGVIATGKHFPGRGDSELDAHDTLDTLRVDRARMDEVELYPYRELIKAGLPSVMTAHNAYTALEDENVPASISKKIVTGLLREELGFEGVITTDAIGMAGVQKIAGNCWNATVQALEAGNDIVLIKEDEETSENCFKAVLEAVKDGRLTEQRLEESIRRILRVKAQFGILDQPCPDPEKADAIVRDPANAEICRESFRKGTILARDRDGLLPLGADEKVLVVEQYIPLYHIKANDAWYHPGMFGESMRAHSNNMLYLETHQPATEEDLRRFRERVARVDTVVFFNIFWRGCGSNRALIRESVKLGKKVVVAANDIYDSYFLPKVGTMLITFGPVPQGSRVAADVIYGKVKAEGKWQFAKVGQNDTVPEDQVVDHFVAGHFAER